MNNNVVYQSYFDSELETREDVFSFIAEIVSEGEPTYKENIIAQLKQREALGSTYIAEHVLLPHVESNQVKKSQILFIRLARPIKKWDTQTKDIQLLIVILLKENENVRIKREIAAFTRSLADEEYIYRLLSMKEQDFENEFKQN